MNVHIMYVHARDAKWVCPRVCQLLYMDNPCNATLRAVYKPALIVLSGTGGAAVLICLLAVILVVAKRLYELFAYRLALYHVVTGLLSGAACVLEALSLLYYPPSSDYPPTACIAVAFTIQYLVWMKLCFTFWVTFHLFSYAVFYKNLKKFELVYVLTALLVPAVVSIIPFTTGSYGLAGSWCWIQTCTSGSEENKAGVIEQFALWYVPSIVLLFLDCVVVVVMVAVLSCRTFVERKGRKEALLVMKRPLQQSALKQLLPLLVYPVTWCLLSIPPLVDRVYDAMNTRNDGLTVANAFCTSAWSLAAGLALVVHIILVSTGTRKGGQESSHPTLSTNDRHSADSALYWTSNYGTSGTVPMDEAKRKGAQASEFERT